MGRLQKGRGDRAVGINTRSREELLQLEASGLAMLFLPDVVSCYLTSPALTVPILSAVALVLPNMLAGHMAQVELFKRPAWFSSDDSCPHKSSMTVDDAAVQLLINNARRSEDPLNNVWDLYSEKGRTAKWGKVLEEETTQTSASNWG